MKAFRLLLASMMLWLAAAGAAAAQDTATFSITMKPRTQSTGSYDTGTRNYSSTLQAVGLPGVVASSTPGQYTVTNASSARQLLGYGWQILNVPYTAATTTGTIALDLENGCTQAIGPISGNVTLTVTDFGYCSDVVNLFFTQNGTGGYAVTFSTGFTDSGNQGFPIIASGISAADVVQFEDNGSTLLYPATGSNPSTVTANSGTIGGCTWTVTLASGAGTSSGLACLAACKNVSIIGSSNAMGGGGPPTTIATPTTGTDLLKCAQPAAGATIVKCLSSNASDSTSVITGGCAN